MEHRSRDLAHRNPYGAVPAETDVRLAVEVRTEPGSSCAVYLGYAYGRGHFHTGRLSMETRDGVTWFRSIRAPGAPVLLFYWFEVESDGKIHILLRNRERADGTGVPADKRPDFHTHERFSQSAFQITGIRRCVHHAGVVAGSGDLSGVSRPVRTIYVAGTDPFRCDGKPAGTYFS
jgi:hypothetical protein